MELEVLYEDAALTVCIKPAGVPTQTAKVSETDMVSLLKQRYAAQGKEPYVGLVHRLDQPVEGVMVFARDKKAVADLSEQVKRREIGKYYLAVVEGVPEDEERTLTDWLLRDGRSNTSKVVQPNTPQAKEAVLEYKVLEQGEGRALVKIHLQTGRHHQIRVQMANAGHPLVGDKKYNPSTEQSIYQPLSLCSYRLEITHPATGKPMKFEIAPKGVQFQQYNWVQNLRLR